jgi:predicted CoA-binding protein
MMDFADAQTIQRIFDSCRVIAVVGLSGMASRPSYRVAAYMQEHGYTIIPVNPNERDVLGQRAYPTLTSIPGPIDLVNIFRRADAVPAIVEEAIANGARAVWLQEGIVHRDSVSHAAAAGLMAVMDHCWLKEHRHRLGR